MIEDLLAHGFDCVNLDINPPRTKHCDFVQIDLTDYEGVFTAMAGCDLLVHYAGYPHPDDDHWGSADRFANNTVTFFNAVNAAIAHGITRVVWASSETIFGYPFQSNWPARVPLSETSTPDPQTGYAISKAASERTAELLAKLHGITIVGLRLSNVLYDDVSAVPSFQKIPGYWDDLAHRKFNLWGYVDSRDAARAVRLGLTTDLSGAEIFNIAATDTVMKQDTRDVLAAVMPKTKIDPGLSGRQALLDCSKARKMLGWVPDYHWTDVLGINPATLSTEGQT